LEDSNKIDHEEDYINFSLRLRKLERLYYMMY